MRLIDADEIGLTDFEIVMCNGDYKEALKMLLYKISNQPAAYDIDNVVAELEKESYQEWCDSPKVVELKDATEIVKQGGVADDVCEWKKYRIIDNVQMYKTSCMNEIEERLVRKYMYCPYCGKKIKVVEQ